MEEVYGDYVHQNLGTHLEGGITDDAMWQGYWCQLIACPSSTYDIPSGAVGKRLIEKIAEELRGLKSQKWSSERFILFSLVWCCNAPELSRGRVTSVAKSGGESKPGRQGSLSCW
jgi:hypothetical protein